METNNKQMVEATAPITTNVNQESNPDGAIHVPSEFFLYMNPTTLENLIADLYSREIQYHDDEDYQELKNVVALVNAIKYLNDYNGIDNSIEMILKISDELYELDITAVDKIILKIMAEEADLLSFDGYLHKAKEFWIENTCLKLLK